MSDPAWCDDKKKTYTISEFEICTFNLARKRQVHSSHAIGFCANAMSFSILFYNSSSHGRAHTTSFYMYRYVATVLQTKLFHVYCCCLLLSSYRKQKFQIFRCLSVDNFFCHETAPHSVIELNKYRLLSMW